MRIGIRIMIMLALLSPLMILEDVRIANATTYEEKSTMI